ncbi:hypothetical protein [Hymenobacter sp.]|uniref:hypothetical protein n=1 Tax=Hymenobacter sp. TaxID=1898978 RepID=UPI00286AC212|nr:hypothetical protein [Hymenobacter sp.]
MGVDAGFQFGTGYLAADPAQGNKFLQAWNGINGTSVVAAGALDTGGLRTKAKFLVALGSATTTNFFTVSGGNDDEYGGYWHTADLGDGKQRIDFLRNVVLGLLFDQTKEYGSEWVAKKMAGRAEAWAAQVSGRASKAMLNWMTETRVAMPTSFVVGGVLEVLKKRWENSQKEG